jgi:RHS repeat-associated protein
MEETSGPRFDSHNGNHLTDNNTVGSTTGLRNKAASFVRTSTNQEFLSIADKASLSGGDVDFTLMANVYLHSTAGTYIIMDKSDDAGYDYRLAHNPTTGFRFRVGIDIASSVDSGAVTADAWHTVIAWHDSVENTINIQVDNGLVQSKTFTSGTMNTTSPLTMGALPDGTYGLNGYLDEVAIYQRVLSGPERTWLYNNGQSRYYSELSITYAYGDTDHTHAVTSLSNGNSYKYDANGNMIQRVVDGQKFALGYDAENRLVKVCQDPSNNAICDTGETVVASFVYNGDGERVKSTLNPSAGSGQASVTTTFVGSHYEITGSTVTKYYFAGSQRVAMRVGGALTYLFSDHLGSTSLTTNGAGVKTSEIRYTAWGEVRYSTTTSASLPTQYTFTGQFSHMDDPTTQPEEGFGLMFYNARWYDPYLNHFTQPDTIVPDQANTQVWDHYAYALNNPLRYNDPSGHKACDDEYGCDNGNSSNNKPDLKKIIKNNDSPKRTPPCEQILAASSCQSISKLLGIGVITLDSTSLGLSATGVILELVGTAGGPEGLAAAIALYAGTLNPIENTIGGISLSISAFNDFFVTGESYIDLDQTYQGTPSVELVLGSDTSVGIVASTLGLSPEGVSDSIINGGAVAYDAYRLSGGKQLVQTHIILTANLNLHFDFSFP